jgi:H+/Cl- antiporter ClcA
MALKGENISPIAFLVKMLFSDITLAFGGSGGVLAPIFFIGSTAGNTFAHLMHQDPVLFSSLGMIGVLAACTNTPISAILMASEIFGPAILLPAAITAAVSFLINGHNSVYPSQILAMKKSKSLDVEVGGEMATVQTTLSEHAPDIHKLINKIFP